MEIMESSVPPGFRFRPTEEELVGYYLKRKINSQKIDLDVIIDIDLYRIEPWDIQDRCKLGYEEQNEWYFFSHKDRKYPTGTRTNRATAAGFWKATGRDKAVLSKDRLIGMRKTLVFYNGRAPNGRKTDWIMHEYRLQTSEHGPPQEEGWVVCRAFIKLSPSHKQASESWNNAYYIRSNNGNYSHTSLPNFDHLNNQGTTSTSLINQLPFPLEQMVELPKLESPSISTSFIAKEDNIDDENLHLYSEWKSFDKLIESQEDIGNSSYGYPNMPLFSHNDEIDAQNHMSHVVECFPDL